MDCLLERVTQMRQAIEPGGGEGLQGLWQWLAKLGRNYWRLTDWKAQLSTR